MQRGAAEAHFDSARGANTPRESAAACAMWRFLFSKLSRVRLLPYNRESRDQAMPILSGRRTRLGGGRIHASHRVCGLRPPLPKSGHRLRFAMHRLTSALRAPFSAKGAKRGRQAEGSDRVWKAGMARCKFAAPVVQPDRRGSSGRWAAAFPSKAGEGGLPPTPARGDILNDTVFPSRDALTVGFAHVAYRAAEAFATRQTGVAHFQVRTLEELERRAPEADVLVVSGLWRNTLLGRGAEAALRAIFQRRHGSVRQGAVREPRRSLGQCPGRQRTRRCGTRDRTSPRADAAAPSRARQPAGAALARHDRRSRPARAGGQRQDPSDRRPRPHRDAPRAARPRFRYAHHRGASHGQAGARRRR